MLDSTLDLINQAVSNNVYAFCLFNLIFVMILMRSKHGSSFDHDYEIPLSTPTPTVTCTYYHHKQLVAEAKQLVVDKGEEEEMNGSIVSGACNETASEENKDDCNGNKAEATDEDDEGDDDIDDDELRRRVEEFIAKVNREWRAEKFGMSISALDLRDRQGC